MDNQTLKMMEKGCSSPTINFERVQIPKPEDKLENEMKRNRSNAKAINDSICALSSNEFNRFVIVKWPSPMLQLRLDLH